MSGWVNGTFTRVHDWTEDEANGENIESDRMDAEDDNFEAGINACLHKGGQNSPTSNLPMGGYKHTGVGDGTVGDNYATVRQVQEGAWRWPATGITGGYLNDYTLTLSPTPARYISGQVFYFKANRTNSGATTLNVNSLGAKSVYSNGAACAGGEIVINRVYSVVYDGTLFHLMGGGSGGGGATFGGAKICMSSSQHIPPDLLTTLTFTTEIYDDSNYFNPVSNGFTIPTTGRYRLSCGIICLANMALDWGDVILEAMFMINGTAVGVTDHLIPAAYGNHPYHRVPVFTMSWEGRLTQNDIIGVSVVHSNTSNYDQDMFGNGAEYWSTWLAIERLA